MDMHWLSRPSRLLPILAGIALIILGVAGKTNEAWGYGLFLVSMITLSFGVVIFAVFVFSRRFDEAVLRSAFATMFKIGGWTYFLAVCALSGFFAHETLAGRMEVKWILFGPTALAALIIFDWGLYKILVGKNLPTWQRFGHLISREKSDPSALRETFVHDVVLHTSLFSVSWFRWFKHTLIFWGFGLMFTAELIAVFLREGLPALGLFDTWYDLGHPVRAAFDFVFDFSGLMVLIGCLLAIGWRIAVNGKPEQKFSDTPTAMFLLVVVASGFAVEALRMAAGDLQSGAEAAAFVGTALARIIPDPADVFSSYYDPLWVFHVWASCAFIAYIPVKRLIHSCATPMGRLMNSQKGLLAAKKHASLKGLLAGDGDD